MLMSLQIALLMDPGWAADGFTDCAAHVFTDRDADIFTEDFGCLSQADAITRILTCWTWCVVGMGGVGCRGVSIYNLLYLLMITGVDGLNRRIKTKRVLKNKFNKLEMHSCRNAVHVLFSFILFCITYLQFLAMSTPCDLTLLLTN
jgi:hypothetical protein